MPGSPEAAEPKGAFELRIERSAGTETYYHCRWLSVQRQLSRSGLRRVRKGIAMLKEVS